MLEGGIKFESKPEHRPYWLRFFALFLLFLKDECDSYGEKIASFHMFPSLFFINNSTVTSLSRTTGNVVKQTQDQHSL